jgi:hypothetical protein
VVCCLWDLALSQWCLMSTVFYKFTNILEQTSIVLYCVISQKITVFIISCLFTVWWKYSEVPIQWISQGMAVMQNCIKELLIFL